MGKTFILIGCCLLLNGCATSQRSGHPNSQGMQSRIDFLEDEMKAKDREIGNIREELRQLKQRDTGKYEQAWIPAREGRTNNQEGAVSKTSNDKSEEIIRVKGVTADQVQMALKRAGFYQGSVDGRIGPKTKEAIKAFQRENNLTVDGIIGRGTWASLKNNL